MLKTVLSIALTAAVCLASSQRNPIVLAPSNGTFNAGEEVVIKWKDATTGFVNIDLVNLFPEVLSAPVVVALGVPAGQNEYKWALPSFLRTAAGYTFRVWGTTPSRPDEKTGMTPLFTVFNNIPAAINAFKVLTPNSDAPCVAGKDCKITWDFPETINGPAFVHLNLFKAGQASPILAIADVPAAQKEYIWQVPADKSLLSQNGLYVSVSGAGTPPAGPGFSNDMGANGQVFAIAEKAPAAQLAGQSSEGQKIFDGKFQEQALLTDTVTFTNTFTETNTITESNAAPSASGSLSLTIMFLIVPLLAFLF